MREKFFENYEKVQVPAKNGKGFRTEYRYIGRRYGWDLEEGALRRRKIMLLAAEAISILIYICAALLPCAFNSMRLSSGLAVLSLIPWIAEIWGVIRLTAARARMTEPDFEEIRNCITIGSVVRAVLLGAAVLTGVLLVLRQGGWNVKDGMAAAGHVFSGAVSYYLFRGYTSLPYELYNNQ